MSFFVRGQPKPSDPAPAWRYRELAKTSRDGTARVLYRDLSSAMARDAAGQLIGFAEVSPGSAVAGDITIQLHPKCRLRGTITCDALSRANKPIGWTNVLLYLENGQQIGECSSRNGEFEFSVPPGRYHLSGFGANIEGRSLNVEVPAGAGAIQAPAIAAEATPLVLLEGKPAPQLQDVMGWKGTPVRLADEVDSAAKLDQKTASFKTSLWHGKDLPFPVALISGEQRRAGERTQGSLADYGIDSYPIAILIDRDGKVVGRFDAGNRDKALAEIDKRLEVGNERLHDPFMLGGVAWGQL